MRGKVIQGFFVGGARLAPPTASHAVAPTSERCAAFPWLTALGRPALLHPGANTAVQRWPAGTAQPAPSRPPLVHGAAAAPVQRDATFARPSRVHGSLVKAATTCATRPLQRFGGDGSFAVDPAQVGLVRSGGKPLPGALLAKMEAAFGADFSGVRVHVGPQASRIGALAFTTGNDLYFAPGQYQPDSIKGQQLIGHELAHVIQQRQGRVRAPGSGVAVVQDRALEAEADRLGMKAANSRLTGGWNGIYDISTGRRNTRGAVQRRIAGKQSSVLTSSRSHVVQRALAAAAPVANPQHRVSKSRTPAIYWFTMDAIDKGASTTLTFIADKPSTIYSRNASQLIVHTSTLSQAESANVTPVTIRDVARAKVFSLGTQLKGAEYLSDVPTSRDEYPYASTLEAGADAFWTYVPVAEQNIQGGQLRALYNLLNDGDRFDVVLVP